MLDTFQKQTKEHANWQGSSKSEHPFSTLNREKCVFARDGVG